MTIAGSKYTVGEILTEKILGINHPTYGRGLWTSGTLRKACRCVRCDVLMKKGTEAYRPQTSGLNRAHRLCVDCVFSLPAAKAS